MIYPVVYNTAQREVIGFLKILLSKIFSSQEHQARQL